MSDNPKKTETNKRAIKNFKEKGGAWRKILFSGGGGYRKNGDKLLL